jgi:predicted DNA-binding protein
MAQLAVYIDDNLSERVDKAAKSSGKSKSEWIADAIEKSLNDQWPQGFFSLAGSWKDDDGPEEILRRIRKGIESSETREELI